MSYQAIARKWRPTTFDEISGQDHVTRTLKNALELDRIHHAFLFTGARGVGKTTAARTLARCLNCHKGPTSTPCGECPSCMDISHGSSSDVTEIDGASNNSVEDVRSLRDSVRYLPSRDKYRVYIIDEVHMLSIGAFNALLKTLEEPPAHVVFIFATTEPQKIPDTILSRVQRFDFKRIPTGVVVDRLQLIIDAEGIKIEPEGLRLIARSGEGSMRDAQSLLDQVIAFGGEDVKTAQVRQILGLVDRGLLFNFLEGLTRAQPELCLESISKVYDYGYELSQFTGELLELLRNAALTVLSPGSHKYIDAPAEELQRLGAICKGLDAETFSRWFQVMLAVHDEVARSSRPRLVLEMAVARLVTVRPVQPLEHLVSRLQGLERTMRQGGVRPSQGQRARSPRGRQGGSASEADDSPSGIGRPGASRAAPAPRSSERGVVTSQAGGAGGRVSARPGSVTPAPSSSAAAKAPQRQAPRPPKQQQQRRAPEGPPPGRFEQGPPPPQFEEQAPASQEPARGRGKPARGGKEPARSFKRSSFQPAPEDMYLPVAPPAPMPEGSAPELRYQSLMRWLEPQKVRYWGAAENTALLSVQGHELRVVVPGQAALKRFQELDQDKALKQAIAILFPGVTSFKASLRSDANKDRLTRREVRREMLAEHRLKLMEESGRDPVIQRAMQALDAKLVDLIPLCEPEGLP